MPIGLLFWFLMILWLIFGLFPNWPGTVAGPWGYAPVFGSILLFVLLLLLGWHEFGFIVTR